jgi:alkane 1-monooxygenase
MLLLSALPPLWRRVMDRRVLDHYSGDIRSASLDPRHERRLLQQHLPAS